MNTSSFQSPWYLPGGQLQTIWPALYGKRFEGDAPQFTRTRVNSPDDDFIDIDWLQGAGTAASDKLLVLFHGLEGSSNSHYALAFAHWARQRPIAMAVPHFRGCSGEVNRQPRAYHSGDHEEIDWLLRHIKAQHPEKKLIALGVSLGGNALMRWGQEQGGSARQVLAAIASVCSPLDLMASGRHIGRGLNRVIYTPMFLRTMKPKAMARLKLHPGLFDARKLMQSRDLYEFDNVFTAPVHGFKDTDDYWTRASAKPRMAEIQISALALNARNDPFMPASSLPEPGKVGKHVTLWQPEHGGHVGFPSGGFPGHLHALPNAVGQWLLDHS